MTDHADYQWTAPPPDPELRRLAPLVGTWEAKDHTEPTTAAGPGVPVHSVESFEWLDGGYFLVSRYETRFGDEPTQTGAMYWGYDTGREAVPQPLLQQQRTV